MDVASPSVEIVRAPGTCGGNPRIAGTRMPVRDPVSYAQLYDGDLTKVQADFPYLSLDTLRAVMVWYEENREEITASCASAGNGTSVSLPKHMP
jgi:uncharacterized protein (DUF433 family)